MNKHIIRIAILAACVSGSQTLSAQTPLDEFLDRVAGQSFYIEAGRAEADVRIAETRSNNSPADPEIEYGYAPGIEETDGHKTTYGISQSISWPGEYAARSKYNKLEREQAETEFQAERQDFLLRVKLLCYEIVHTQKQQDILNWQQANAEQILDLTQKRLAQGDATSLDVNNARLNVTSANTAWFEGKSTLDTKRRQLILLTGFDDFEVNDFGYIERSGENVDALLAEAQSSDVNIRTAQLENDKSRRNISVARGSTLPSFNIGIAGERLSASDSFLGPTIGMSIPLWGGSGQVKVAKAQQVAAELRSKTIQTDVESSLTELAGRARRLQESLEQYGSLKDVRTGIELLNKSFELKNISVLEYFTNLSFFFQIEREYLDLELEFNQTLAELTKFRL